jgi:hypothetical protein
MESIFGYADFVNKQAEFHEKKVEEFQGNKRAWVHKTTARSFRGLQKEIENLRSATIIRKANGINPLALSPNDVSGLPPALLEQLLNKPEQDSVETEICDIINGAGGTLLIDHIMIALFKRTGMIHDRPQLVSKIHRMNKKDLIFSVPGKKGVYTTIKPSHPHNHHQPEDIPDAT